MFRSTTYGNHPYFETYKQRQQVDRQERDAWADQHAYKDSGMRSWRSE